MLSWIREKFGTVVIGGIITFIAFVFVFYGVFSPKSTRGLHEGAVAGTVNGDAISISEFNREFNRRLEFFKNLGGGKISDEQLKAFHIREGVFQELANRKLMLQEANRQGLVASDDQVKEKIQEISSFQKDGKFDLPSYKKVLEANNYTPAGFEKLVREDLSSQKWQAYFESRSHVSEAELKKEFLLNEDKRKLKYVVLSNDSAKKQVAVGNDEVKKFLSDSTKLNLAKMKFEELKNTLYKGQTFEIAQNAIAKDILASEKRDEIQKINSNLADQILPLMAADKASDSKLNAILKSSETQVKVSDFITRRNGYLPQLGEAKEIMADAFATQSPIDLTQGGKAKKYQVAGMTVVAVVLEKKSPDLSQLDTQRMALLRQSLGRKTRDFYSEWMKQLSAKASIEINPAVVNAE